MDYRNYYYIFFFIIIVLLIFIKYFNYEELFEYIFQESFEEDDDEDIEEGFQEGIKFPSIGSIKRAFQKPIKKAQKGINKAIKSSQKGINTAINKTKKALGGPLMQMFKAFKRLPGRFRNIQKGFNNIFFGIGNVFKYLGIGIGRGIEDISLLIAYTFEYLFSYILCGVKFISNIPNCILYYSVDCIIQIFYLPIRITLWFMYIFLRINLYPAVNEVWKMAEWVNSKIYTTFGFNIIRWPKNVRDECYNCKRLKTSVLMQKGKEIDYDFKHNIPNIMKKGGRQIKLGGRQINRAFK